jgi:hypothetical protein
MPEENLENINLERPEQEKPERPAGNVENPEQFFDRKEISSDIEAARVKEILGKLSDTKTGTSGKGKTAASTQKEDDLVAGFLKEAFFGKRGIDQVINEVKNTGNPYIIDSFHDQLMDKLKNFKENK